MRLWNMLSTMQARSVPSKGVTPKSACDRQAAEQEENIATSFSIHV